jgi:hypothetical protein
VTTGASTPRKLFPLILVSIPSFSRVSEAFTRREIGFERGNDGRQYAVDALGFRTHRSDSFRSATFINERSNPILSGWLP